MSIRIRGKLVFLRHPRTGSTATAEALIKVGGHRVGVGQHNFFPAGRGEVTVSTVRNPYDTLATWFVLNTKYDTMQEFLEKYSHNKYLRDGRLYYFADISDVVLLYDRLQDDLNKLLRRLQLGHVRIYRVNTTSAKRPFMEYFDATSQRLVEEKFTADLECYRGHAR